MNTNQIKIIVISIMLLIGCVSTPKMIVKDTTSAEAFVEHKNVKILIPKIDSLMADSNFIEFVNCMRPDNDYISLHYFPMMHTISISTYEGKCAELMKGYEINPPSGSMDISCISIGGSGFGYTLDKDLNLIYVQEIPGDFGYRLDSWLSDCARNSSIKVKTSESLKKVQ